MNICFILNNWDKLNPEEDSTLRLIHEAVLRNHNVCIGFPSNLTIRNSLTYGYIKKIVKKDKYSGNFSQFHKKLEFKEQMLPLAGFDVIFLRHDPPVDPVMLNFLDPIKDQTFIVNDVDGLRKANNKLYTACLNDPKNEIIPVTHVSKNKEFLQRVISESDKDKMILKPLDGFGGSGVIVVEKRAKQNINSLLDFYISGKNVDQYVIMQEFVEGAEKGDTRVLMLNGKILGAYKRIPSENDIRANIKAGGSAIKHNLTKQEKKICNIIGPKLVADGLYFVGLDIIMRFVKTIMSIVLSNVLMMLMKILFWMMMTTVHCTIIPTKKIQMKIW